MYTPATYNNVPVNPPTYHANNEPCRRSWPIVWPNDKGYIRWWPVTRCHSLRPPDQDPDDWKKFGEKVRHAFTAEWRERQAEQAREAKAMEASSIRYPFEPGTSFRSELYVPPLRLDPTPPDEPPPMPPLGDPASFVGSRLPAAVVTDPTRLFTNVPDTAYGDWDHSDGVPSSC